VHIPRILYPNGEDSDEDGWVPCQSRQVGSGAPVSCEGSTDSLPDAALFDDFFLDTPVDKLFEDEDATDDILESHEYVTVPCTRASVAILFPKERAGDPAGRQGDDCLLLITPKSSVIDSNYSKHWDRRHVRSCRFSEQLWLVDPFDTQHHQWVAAKSRRTLINHAGLQDGITRRVIFPRADEAFANFDEDLVIR